MDGYFCSQLWDYNIISNMEFGTTLYSSYVRMLFYIF